MARISTYGLDEALEGGDKIIGSDVSSNYATMNFSLDQLGEFYSRTGSAQSSVTFTFDVGTGYPNDELESEHAYFNGITFDTINELRFSNEAHLEINTEAFAAILPGTLISINQVGDNRGANYGFFEVTAVSTYSVNGVDLGYTATIEKIDGTVTYIGDIPSDYVSITPYGQAANITGSVGTLGFSQTSGVLSLEGQEENIIGWTTTNNIDTLVVTENGLIRPLVLAGGGGGTSNITVATTGVTDDDSGVTYDASDKQDDLGLTRSNGDVVFDDTDILLENSSEIHFHGAPDGSGNTVEEAILDYDTQANALDILMGPNRHILLNVSGTGEAYVGSIATGNEIATQSDLSGFPDSGSTVTVTSGSTLTNSGSIDGNGNISISVRTDGGGSGGGNQFADQDALELFISDKPGFRTDIGAGTSSLELGTSSTTALAGDTALLQLGTTSTTALAGDTVVGEVNQTITTTSPITGATSATADPVTIGIDETQISISATQLSEVDTTSGNIGEFLNERGEFVAITGGTGSNGQSVDVYYADDADGTNSNRVRQAGQDFIGFAEFTAPATSTAPATFVQFVGEADNGVSVEIFYADDANGGNSSTTQGSREFIAFVEYTVPAVPAAPTAAGSFSRFTGGAATLPNGTAGQVLGYATTGTTASALSFANASTPSSTGTDYPVEFTSTGGNITAVVKVPTTGSGTGRIPSPQPTREMRTQNAAGDDIVFNITIVDEHHSDITYVINNVAPIFVGGTGFTAPTPAGTGNTIAVTATDVSTTAMTINLTATDGLSSTSFTQDHTITLEVNAFVPPPGDQYFYDEFSGINIPEYVSIGNPSFTHGGQLTTGDTFQVVIPTDGEYAVVNIQNSVTTSPTFTADGGIGLTPDGVFAAADAEADPDIPGLQAEGFTSYWMAMNQGTHTITIRF